MFPKQEHLPSPGGTRVLIPDPTRNSVGGSGLSHQRIKRRPVLHGLINEYERVA
jgi:hypothetical protein